MGEGTVLPANVIALPGVTARDVSQARKGNSATLVRHAATIADMFGEKLAGFVVVGLSDEGYYLTGFRTPSEGILSPMIFHSVVVEILRRDMVTQQEIKSELRRRHLTEDDE